VKAIEFFIKVVVVVVGFGIGLTIQSSHAANNIDGRISAGLSQLKGSSKAVSTAYFERGIPVVVVTQTPVGKGLQKDPVAASLDYLNRFSSLYRIQNPLTNLYPVKVDAEKGGYSIHLGQKINNIPVLGAGILVHIKDNEVRETVGDYLVNVSLPAKAEIGAVRAQQIASKKLSVKGHRVVGETTLTYISKQLATADTHLAWQVGLETPGVDAVPTQTFSYLIDARSGDVLQSGPSGMQAGLKSLRGMLGRISDQASKRIREIADSEDDGEGDGEDDSDDTSTSDYYSSTGRIVAKWATNIHLDSDQDSIPNLFDNCDFVFNPSQADADNDGVGDACQDFDGDSVIDINDNCPLIVNPAQENNDHDTEGDVCDADDDNDHVVDIGDNCPLLPNRNQTDADGDSVGDVCDNCMAVANEDQLNSDDDEQGNACDADDDNDTVADDDDNCPLQPNMDQRDDDNNGIGYVCDNAEQTVLWGKTEVEYWADFLEFEKTLARAISIPIEPCMPAVCPDWIGPDFFLKVDFRADRATKIRIYDNVGNVVAESEMSQKSRLIFSPDAASYYKGATLLKDNVTADKVEVFRGNRYYLQVDNPYGAGKQGRLKVEIAVTAGAK